ncbi:hypothetical protein Vadar_007499 [Vaccinium darrowii]|uniref:Uncharacterized protein n=1 Tax=Vaccinium darrowii TaxID=229202 RepID=A0ACB7XQ96_9ERIC|nr:hypothetical protein Vadar_007499 [Vaccinium darrowii]
MYKSVSFHFEDPSNESKTEKKSGAANCNRENQRNSSKSGTGVRIRVVVTQRELIQILRNNKSKYSSVEQLLTEMKLKRRRKIIPERRLEALESGEHPRRTLTTP